jgi:hypothetical protein
MVEVTVPLTISKYAGYLSMSRHALNFIVEGLQSPVPNHVVCEVNCLVSIIFHTHQFILYDGLSEVLLLKMFSCVF